MKTAEDELWLIATQPRFQILHILFPLKRCIIIFVALLSCEKIASLLISRFWTLWRCILQPIQEAFKIVVLVLRSRRVFSSRKGTLTVKQNRDVKCAVWVKLQKHCSQHFCAHFLSKIDIWHWKTCYQNAVILVIPMKHWVTTSCFGLILRVIWDSLLLTVVWRLVEHRPLWKATLVSPS